MANEQNLEPLGNGKRTKSEERAIQSKGGKKSGESRRRKRDMREAAKLLLDMPISQNQQTMKAILQSLGVADDEANYQMGVMAAMLLQAANGNVNAATFLRDTAGDNPNVKIREEELRQRKAEFKFQKEQKLKEQEQAGSEETLADTIVSAYQKRMEGDKE